jgi:tubulin polyglutamylase TTLL6/13
MVAQLYIDDPFLIDGLKFDLRIYVLLYGINPLKIYLFDDGLARFATKQYQSAAESDLKDMFIHLTNYSINKKNENFIQNENNNSNAHKRSLKDIFSYFETHGHKTRQLKEDIRELIIKTLITGQNYLNHVYRQV